MPELSRFFGIIIRMFMEAGEPHHTPHLHAYYQNYVAVFSIDPVEMIAGNMPGKQKHLIEDWMELHSGELKECWELLQDGQRPKTINPLR